MSQFRVRLLSCLVHPPSQASQSLTSGIKADWLNLDLWSHRFEPTLFRVVGMDTSRPPHFDGTNFSDYKAKMACYLEAVDLGVWRVTRGENH